MEDSKVCPPFVSKNFGCPPYFGGQKLWPVLPHEDPWAHPSKQTTWMAVGCPRLLCSQLGWMAAVWLSWSVLWRFCFPSGVSSLFHPFQIPSSSGIWSPWNSTAHQITSLLLWRVAGCSTVRRHFLQICKFLAIGPANGLNVNQYRHLPFYGFKDQILFLHAWCNHLLSQFLFLLAHISSSMAISQITTVLKGTDTWKKN